MKKILAIVLCLVMVLGVVGCQSNTPADTDEPKQTNDNNTPANTDAPQTSGEPAEESPYVEDATFRYLYPSEISTLNYLATSSTVDFKPASNFVDTLIEYDQYGVVKPCLATSWETSDDGLVWTFHLREGVKWYDCELNEYADVTADDFVFGAEWILTPANESDNVDTLANVIVNAKEYFDGTVTDFAEVGVKALDEHTLQYTLKDTCPYFLSMMTYVAFMPANRQFVEECGEYYGTSNDTLLYNGAYYCTSWEPQNELVMERNDNYWDAENVSIKTVYGKYNAEAEALAPEMYLRGEIDEATIGSDILDSWLADDTTKDMVSMDRPNTNYTYFYMFNFMPFAHEFSNWNVEGVDAEYEPENWAKAINNTNFRKAFLYGINNAVTLAVSAPLGYDSYKLNTITPPNFCATADGVDYTQCGGLADLTEFFDEAKAKEYRDAAIEELTAQGVTFPIKVQLPYNPSSTDWDKQCQVLKQQLEGVLNDGTDFIDIIITAGPSDSFLSAVRRNGKFEFLLCNWGADYSDPETETDPFYQAKDSRGMRYAYLRTGVEDGFITGETADAVMAYMNAIEAAKQITDDIDARYKAFADAEALLITNALVIPRGMSVPAYLATRLNYWEGQYASIGFSNKRLKGIHVLDHYVSMEEYEANRDAR